MMSLQRMLQPNRYGLVVTFLILLDALTTYVAYDFGLSEQNLLSLYVINLGGWIWFSVFKGMEAILTMCIFSVVKIHGHFSRASAVLTLAIMISLLIIPIANIFTIWGVTV